MKKYILGHYDQSESDSRILYKETNRKILRALRDSYPNGLDNYQLCDMTKLPLKTIYPQVNELLRERFIHEILPEGHRRGRPETGSPVNTITGRTRSKFAIEEVTDLYDKSENKRSAPLPPGNIMLPSGIQQAWEHIVSKEEEEELENNLLNFLAKSLRRVMDSDKHQIRELAPTVDKNFLCLQCGVNHEARDFMRAMLLLLLDQFERNIKYLEFLRAKNFLTDTAFDHAKSKISKTKEVRHPILEGTHKVTLRILSIEKKPIKNLIKFFAINKSQQFFCGSIDYQLVTDEMVNDTVIACITENIYHEEGPGDDDDFNIKLSQDESYVRVEPDDPTIPKSSQLITKIVDVQKGQPYTFYLIEGEILMAPSIEMDIDHRGRQPIFHTVIGDETGQIPLEERYSNYLQDKKRGDKVRVIGAFTDEDEVLELGPYGSIIRIR